MTDADPPARESQSADDSRQRPLIDRNVVQYLDRVRAVFRPTGDGLAPSLERFVGREDVFRHVGLELDGVQAMMECPVHWPSTTKWVPIRDLEILEILEDQDVRAG